MTTSRPKRPVWVGSSLNELRAFPEEVRRSWATDAVYVPHAFEKKSKKGVLEQIRPESDELITKATLAHQIASIATHRHLTQSETARLLGTTQPSVSDLFVGKLAGFSMERLIRFLNTLDRDVRIVVSPKPRSRSRAVLQVTGQGAREKAGRK